MGSISGHRIDYNEVGALRGQQHIPSKNLPKYPPPPRGTGMISTIVLHCVQYCVYIVLDQWKVKEFVIKYIALLYLTVIFYKTV